MADNSSLKYRAAEAMFASPILASADSCRCLPNRDGQYAVTRVMTSDLKVDSMAIDKNGNCCHNGKPAAKELAKLGILQSSTSFFMVQTTGFLPGQRVITQLADTAKVKSDSTNSGGMKNGKKGGENKPPAKKEKGEPIKPPKAFNPEKFGERKEFC